MLTMPMIWTDDLIIIFVIVIIIVFIFIVVVIVTIIFLPPLIEASASKIDKHLIAVSVEMEVPEVCIG